ncbi:MAG: primosomal protein N' [Firmicutes bacterium]|nr:primosomal protein N' [Bacillota bacterium]
MLLLEVLIEHATFSLDRPFSYAYHGPKKVEAGYRVLVDFNHRQSVAYVLNVTETDKAVAVLEEEKGFSIHEILDVIDEEKLLNPELMQLAEEISNAYFSPRIGVLQTMLPPSMKPKLSSLKAPKIAYDCYVELVDASEQDLTDHQIEWMRLLVREKRILKKDFKSPSILKILLSKERVKLAYDEKQRLVLPTFLEQAPKKLTEDQQNAVDAIWNSKEAVYLLEGVTGSGKTEVYLSLSEKVLAAGKTVLMLVPEIALTPIMVEYFIRRFHGRVAILHSELTPAEKYDEYRRIARGECQVVVGARSAIFAPLDNIGLLVLDEEHVESYKQDTSPTYHARDIAIMRGKHFGAKVVLGSATPSLESRARAMKGVYHYLALPHRINEQEMPETTIVDLLNPRNLDRESVMFSLLLRERIKATLTKGEQVVLLVNRRGYAPYISCRSCGHVFKCPNCAIALTYHREDGMLKCHHCDHVEMMPDKCPECGSKYLSKQGFGTEKIEEEAHRLFPGVRTLRLDSDTTKVRNRISQTLDAFRNHEADMLIGTQMIAKGHDFPNVTLVGIVLADIGLTLPSYRSAERTFQLITQAVGRAGRGDKKGIAVIQTYMPTHYAVTLGAKQDYEAFFTKEMGMRKIQQYPPYTYLVSLTLSGHDEEAVVTTIYSLAEQLSKQLEGKATILGPTAPYIAVIAGIHRRVILVKYKKASDISEAITTAIDVLSGKSQIKLMVNVDPYDF